MRPENSESAELGSWGRKCERASSGSSRRLLIPVGRFSISPYDDAGDSDLGSVDA